MGLGLVEVCLEQGEHAEAWEQGEHAEAWEQGEQGEGVKGDGGGT